MTIAGNSIPVKTINIVIPPVGAALMIAYDLCATSCTYLSGTFLGVDLKWIGIMYMAVLFMSAFIMWEKARETIINLRTALLSMAVGVEFYLVGFQVVKNIFCPFCLAFGACIFLVFGANYALMNKRVMVATAAIALLGFALCFEGQATPRFDL